jgi:nicotinate-nucleotide--dimethylbenzimidazole phosphoribosyltransferase
MLEECLKSITPADEEGKRLARERADRLLMPKRALGRLLELGEKVAGITGFGRMELSRKIVVVMAGDHGVTEEGVSAYPREVTAQMVRGFVRGHAGINVLARHAGIDVRVVDMGCASDLSDLVRQGSVLDAKVSQGTRNIRRGPAMDRSQAIQALDCGIRIARDLADSGVQMIGTGDMGIGNTTPSTAIAALACGRPPSEIVGRGTGIDDKALARKTAVIEESIAANRPELSDPVGVLAKIGGFEIGGLAGLILGAAERRLPVVVDGVVSTAAALIAFLLKPCLRDFMFCSHRSMEPSQHVMLELMGLEPILDLGMRLGEGTGSALAMPIIEAGAKVIKEMATFAEAGMSGG